MNKKTIYTRFVNKLRKNMTAILTVGLSFMLISQIEAQDLPKFEEFTVEVLKVSPKTVQIGNDPNARKFRTQLRQANKNGINFAGHFIVASWGCGSGCTQAAIIDAVTGKVHFPDELFGGFGISAGHPEDSLDIIGYFEFKPDSRMVVLNGWGGENYGVRYFVWEDEKLRLEKFVEIEIDEEALENTDGDF